MMLLAVLQFVLFAVNPNPARAADVTPILFDQASNATCAELAGAGQTWTELKVDPNADGSYTDGTLSVTISNTTDDKTFDWSSNIGVDAVYVKAGQGGSYLYQYDPPAEATSDTGLTSPGDGITNGISHIAFCYDVELPPRVPKTCPTPDVEGAIVAEFEGKVYASGNGAFETAPVSIDLPAGIYDVYLTGYDDNHSETWDPTQEREQFFVRGFFDGTAVWDSPVISDLPTEEIQLTEKVASSVSIPALDSIKAIHDAYPSDFSDSIYPVCVVFVPQETPTNPTPVSVVVSGTCAVLQSGNVARVSVDSITPDGDVVVTIGGQTIAEGATADLALDTPLAVSASSPSGAFAPTTNVASLNISSAGCGTQPPPISPPPAAPLSALGDLVWADENDNGRQDAGEIPVPGATVTLLSTDGTVLGQQVTADDGLYLFDQLEAGNYRVEVCLAGAEFTTTDAPGVADDMDSDVFVLADKPGCARTGIINLPAGVTDLTWDAGILVDVGGIQIEPTTTTAPPPVDTVTVDTLPFTGFENEGIAAMSIGVLIAGAALLLIVGRREDELDSSAAHSGWTNH
jgi:hypothetical protein